MVLKMVPAPRLEASLQIRERYTSEEDQAQICQMVLLMRYVPPTPLEALLGSELATKVNEIICLISDLRNCEATIQQTTTYSREIGFQVLSLQVCKQ